MIDEVYFKVFVKNRCKAWHQRYIDQKHFPNMLAIAAD